MNTDDRQETVNALRALADRIEANPDLPAPGCTLASVHMISGTDEEQRAEVDRIAAVLSVTTTVNQAGTHYVAERSFGGGVPYLPATRPQAAPETAQAPASG